MVTEFGTAVYRIAHLSKYWGVINTGRPLPIKYWGVATPTALTPMRTRLCYELIAANIELLRKFRLIHIQH